VEDLIGLVLCVLEMFVFQLRRRGAVSSACYVTRSALDGGLSHRDACCDIALRNRLVDCVVVGADGDSFDLSYQVACCDIVL
jgi:hypothetical protein